MRKIAENCNGGMDFFFLEAHALIRDHPRLRGEYYLEEWKERFYLGSPPLARGIRTNDNSESLYARITPACAGNTATSTYGDTISWDHPRLRGEYAVSARKKEKGLGSPPLARGIRSTTTVLAGYCGITPACAGNTGIRAFRKPSS